jgi:hypothetical protein
MKLPQKKKNSNENLPLDDEGQGSQEGGADEVAVGGENVGAHTGAQRQLGHHVHRCEAELHQHHGYGRQAVPPHGCTAL